MGRHQQGRRVPQSIGRCKSTKRETDWLFFTVTLPLEVFRSLLVCATIEELPNDVGQRMSLGRHVTFTVDPESGWRLGHVHTDRQSFLPFVPFTNSTSAGNSDPH